VHLRNHIIEIRDKLREDFDSFFNELLGSIRKDWNLFSVQETLVKEVQAFNSQVTDSL
jgi:hypothetical protein